MKNSKKIILRNKPLINVNYSDKHFIDKKVKSLLKKETEIMKQLKILK